MAFKREEKKKKKKKKNRDYSSGSVRNRVGGDIYEKGMR
jgi:hypothetical protein